MLVERTAGHGASSIVDVLERVLDKKGQSVMVASRRLHDLRRSAVRNMEQAGVPRSVAMKLTGHRTENVYRRYAIVSDADLQEASRRLARA